MLPDLIICEDAADTPAGYSEPDEVVSCVHIRAPASRLRLFASNGLGQEAARGGRPLAPLIGRAARLILLFCLNGQRLKEAAAAGRAQRVGGGGRCCLGNRAASTRLPLAGRSGSVWRLRVAQRLRRRHNFPLQGHGDRKAAPTAVHARAWAAGKERGRDCQDRREEGIAPSGLGGSPFGESWTAKQGKEHSRDPTALRKEVGSTGCCRMGPRMQDMVMGNILVLFLSSTHFEQFNTDGGTSLAEDQWQILASRQTQASVNF
ncbi:uncharacterized protein [Kogia breviceps]|uniref:uncharacterized protein n=1 Tax=Kogia breviceps TaxID=27615 RepID=UPI0034D33F1C